MLNKNIPGTNIEFSNSDDVLSVFKPIIESTGGLSLSQLCNITGLQASTIQNWVKRGFVPRPEGKRYYERHLYRVLLIAAMRDCLNIEEIGELMVLINGDTDDVNDDIISEARLYDCFCKAIRGLDEASLDEEKIAETIEKILEGERTSHKDRLLLALKVMVYAYIAGNCLSFIKNNLDRLRRI